MPKKQPQEQIDKKPFAISWVDPNQLKPYERNAKLHSPEQVASIAAQISAFGFDVPIVINKKNVIVKGHGRQLAAIHLGLKKVPVIITDLSDKQIRAARIGDNKVSEAPWLPDMLKIELEDLVGLDFDMALTGFNSDELKEILGGWNTDHESVENTEENLDPISGMIKIRCPQNLKDRLVEQIQKLIKQNKYEGIIIA